MIIDNLDLEGITVPPSKTDSPLVIDANTVLTGAIASELLQPVPGWDAEVLKLFGRVHDAELSQHEAMELGGKASDALTVEQPLRVAIGEAGDHKDYSNATQP